MSHDIFAAISGGDKDEVTRLVAADPQVGHARNQAGVSALMQARYEDKLEMVALLRKPVGDLDVFEAAALGDVPRIHALLKADRDLIKARSSDGFTPLHLACFFGQLEAAQTLIRQRADANAGSPSRIAVIHSAAASRNAAVVRKGKIVCEIEERFVRPSRPESTISPSSRKPCLLPSNSNFRPFRRIYARNGPLIATPATSRT